ncbi:MAG: protein translocase subunit SecD [Bacteroidetes bacterium]|nr:protein translocase subunit SecD [Bacteroidota bacterium]
MKKNLTRIVLTVFLIILSLYFLYPTYQDYNLSKELKGKTGQDSIDFVDKNGEKLKSARDKRIKLGLDLKGGMYVVLDVDIVKLLEDLAKKKDATLTAVLNETKEATKGNDEAIFETFKQKLQAKGLSLKSYYGEIRDEEKDVDKKLKDEIDGALDRAVEIVRNRIDQYGVAEPQIQKIGGSRIIVELPGVSNQEEVRKLLQGTAMLEFKLVKDAQSTVKVMEAINNVMVGNKDTTNTVKDSLKTNTLDSTKNKTSLTSADTTKSKNETAGKNKKDSTKVTDKKVVDKKDTTKTKKDTTKTKKDSAITKADTTTPADTNKQLSEEEIKAKYPFFTLVQLNQQSGVADGYVREADKDKVDRLLAREDVKAVIPSDMTFAWGNRTVESPEGKIYTLYAIKKDAELTGKVITNARANIDPTNNTPVVTMEMNTEGSADWSRITGSNIGKRIAIVLDNAVFSAPVVRGKISGGNSQIEGMANIQEAKLLEIVLKAGALPAPVKIIEERSIGPSLGEDSIKAGIFSSLAALILVALFMIVYYRVGGTVADVALVINVLFILGIMASLKATLTVPGIAGLILTLGMAVDTNVLIFERIREELATGKPLKTALEVGYKKAFSAIFDSHVTSIITGLILYQFGTGPIQGFALTLLFGLVANLFTAIVITHFIFDIMIEKGKEPSFG